MLDSLRPRVEGLVHEFEAGSELWLAECFRLSQSKQPAIMVRREQSGHDEFRDRLENAEHVLKDVLNEPNRDLVLSYVRRTQQVIHLTPCASVEIGSSRMARICEQLCGYLARTNGGLIQVYQEGFFTRTRRVSLAVPPATQVEDNVKDPAAILLRPPSEERSGATRDPSLARTADRSTTPAPSTSWPEPHPARTGPPSSPPATSWPPWPRRQCRS